MAMLVHWKQESAGHSTCVRSRHCSRVGAVEMALWSLLGERSVDVLAWESFSGGWASDCKNQLWVKDLRIFKADYGKLPDLHQVN
jgi:phosphoserine aminotransferase